MPRSYRDVEQACVEIGLKIVRDRGKGGHRLLYDGETFLYTFDFHGSNEQLLNSEIKAIARAIARARPQFDTDAWASLLMGRPKARRGKADQGQR